MFILCQAFEFKHLPMPGGLYDQNPWFLDRMMYILAKQEEHRKLEESRDKRSQSTGRGKGLRGSSRRGY